MSFPELENTYNDQDAESSRFLKKMLKLCGFLPINPIGEVVKRKVSQPGRWYDMAVEGVTGVGASSQAQQTQQSSQAANERRAAADAAAQERAAQAQAESQTRESEGNVDITA